MAFIIETNLCHPEGETRRIYKNGIQEILHFVQNDKKCAFTLAEVLITLGIIGIVAAMTLPALIGKAEKMILAQQFKKSYANIQNAINAVQADYGGAYECYNIGSAVYKLNGCRNFWSALINKMNVVQKCENDDYDCHPKYKTKAEVLAEGGEVINSSCSMDFPYAIYYILYDGSYLIINNANSSSAPQHSVFFGLDVNGKKGPNKWGYDLFYLTLNREDLKKDVVATHKVCAMKEKGGDYLLDMFLK